MSLARSLLILCLAFVTLVPVSAQRGASRFDPIVETARHELAEAHTPGAAIALVEGDRVVFETGVGVADVETATPVKPEMLFRLGSTTSPRCLARSSTPSAALIESWTTARFRPHGRKQALTRHYARAYAPC